MTERAQIVTTNRLFSVTPTIDTVAYVAGDAIGGLETISSMIPTGGSGYIESINLLDKGAANTNIDFIFFNADPTSSTITNNTAIDIDDTDIDKIVGTASISTNNYTNFTDNSASYISNVNIPLQTTVDRNVYVAMIERGTPTRAVGDIIVNYITTWIGE